MSPPIRMHPHLIVHQRAKRGAGRDAGGDAARWLHCGASLLATLFLALAVALSGAARAQGSASSPVGEWRTFGDTGANPRGVVRITEKDGVLTGVITRSLVPGEDPNKLCTRCTDERKDKLLRGMAILTGMKPFDDGYGGGEILDPDTGAIYRCNMKLADSGRRLVLRGYIGFTLFGRTQEWVRIE